MSIRKKATKEILEGVIKAGKQSKSVKPKRTYNTKKQNDIRKANNKAELDALKKKKATPPPKRATDPKPPIAKTPTPKKPPLQKVSTVKQTRKEASKEGFDNSRVLPPNVKVTKIPKTKPVKTPVKKAVKKPVKKAVKKVPVKKAVKKPIKKAVKKPVKKAVKKPVKKAVKKAVKTPTKKPTKPEGVSGGAFGKDAKGNIIVMGGKKGDLKKAQEFYRNQAKNADVRQRPKQGPPTRAEQAALNSRGKPTGPVQGPRGGKEAYEAFQKGRSYFRENFGKNVKRIAKQVAVDSAKGVGKGAKSLAGPAVVGGAVYYGMKSNNEKVRNELKELRQTVNSMNSNVTPAKPNQNPTPVSTSKPKPKPKPTVESPNQRRNITPSDSWKKIAKKYGYNF